MNRIQFRSAVRYTIAAALAAAFASAFATMPPWDYRIKLSKDTGDLNVVVHAFVGPAVTVGIENHSAKTVRCSASFVSYPHTPSKDETVSTKIAAGKHAALAYPLEKLGANISTAFVHVKCGE